MYNLYYTIFPIAKNRFQCSTFYCSFIIKKEQLPRKVFTEKKEINIIVKSKDHSLQSESKNKKTIDSNETI